jgi:hypothetical protein
MFFGQCTTAPHFFVQFSQKTRAQSAAAGAGGTAELIFIWCLSWPWPRTRDLMGCREAFAGTTSRGDAAGSGWYVVARASLIPGAAARMFRLAAFAGFSRADIPPIPARPAGSALRSSDGLLLADLPVCWCDNAAKVTLAAAAVASVGDAGGGLPRGGGHGDWPSCRWRWF